MIRDQSPPVHLSFMQSCSSSSAMDELMQIQVKSFSYHIKHQKGRKYDLGDSWLLVPVRQVLGFQIWLISWDLDTQHFLDLDIIICKQKHPTSSCSAGKNSLMVQEVWAYRKAVAAENFVKKKSISEWRNSLCSICYKKSMTGSVR